MKTTLKSGLAAGALGLALSTGVFIGTAVAEQEHMENALASLQTARTELRLAEANKGGHRVKAIRLVDDAIEQVRMGIEHAE